MENTMSKKLLLIMAATVVVAANSSSIANAQSAEKIKPPSFAIADTNNNGIIEKDEFQEMQNKRVAKASLGGKTLKVPAFEAVDANGDGGITEDEMKSWKPAK
jgi:hypothetical protein